MSLGTIPELSFADGYYSIGWEKDGVVSFVEGTPEDIIQRFWKEWPAFREKVLMRQKKGYLDSLYPYLPEEDPEENKRNYYVNSENL